MEINKLTEKIIVFAIAIHKGLGPGLFESTYEQCLAREFTLIYKGTNSDIARKRDKALEYCIDKAPVSYEMAAISTWLQDRSYQVFLIYLIGESGYDAKGEVCFKLSHNNYICPSDPNHFTLAYDLYPGLELFHFQLLHPYSAADFCSERLKEYQSIWGYKNDYDQV